MKASYTFISLTPRGSKDGSSTLMGVINPLLKIPKALVKLFITFVIRRLSCFMK